MSFVIDLLGGFVFLVGGSLGVLDIDVFYEYICSQDMVEKIDVQLDLWQCFLCDWLYDFVFVFDFDSYIEDMIDYWDCQVKVLYDIFSGFIMLKVNVFIVIDV